MTSVNYNIVFYDFEVFKYDWLVVFIDYKTRKKKIIINNTSELKTFYEKTIDKNYIYVGYNSRNYDSVILKALLLGLNPYEVSDKIINKDMKAYQILGKTGNDIKLLNFDISTRLHSLKQLEGFMGSKIKESDIDFNISRKLTSDEILETIEYCTHDVEQTIEVFENLREEFDSQISLVEAFNLPLEDLNKTKAQLSAKILDTEKQERDDEWELIYPDTLKLDKYSYILDWFKDSKNHSGDKSLYTEIAGIPHVVAWGGLHGSEDNLVYKDKILCADVASLYPSIMIEYGLLSRNVKEPQKYKEIRDTRLKLKKEKNPMQLPYKIVLNSTYGASGDKYNPLYDMRMCRSVCMTGQLLLIDLIEKIEPYCRLLQSNTDGVYLAIEDDNNISIIEDLIHEWEVRTRLDMEIEWADGIYQKDVNNYLLLEGDKYKSKGAYVKKLKKIDYDLPIINKALINYLIGNKPIAETINECDDLIEFQKIVKVSKLFEDVLYGEQPLKERVNRVFASTRDEDFGIFMVKNGSPNKIANTPEKCFIYNDNVLGVKIPTFLDKQYYINTAEKRLNDFFTKKEKSHKEKFEIKGVSNEGKNQIYEINKNKTYSNILDLYYDLSNLLVNKTQLRSLIKLNYLSSYSDCNTLLAILDLFEKVGTCINLSFIKCDKLNLNKSIVEECCEKTSKTSYCKIDNRKLIKALFKNMDIKPSTTLDLIKNEITLLGYSNITDKTYDDTSFCVQSTEKNQWNTTFATLYQINNGKTKTVYIDKKKMLEYPVLEQGTMISGIIKEEPKSRKATEEELIINPKTQWYRTGEMKEVLSVWCEL